MDERTIKLFRRHIVEQCLPEDLRGNFPPADAFQFAFAVYLLIQSCRRPMREDYDGLVVETARSLFHQEFVAFLHHYHLCSYGPQWLADYEAAFSASCEADTVAIGSNVELILDEECAELFGAYYAQSNLHPMFYLQHYLDELDHMKDTHPDEHRARFKDKARVAVLYRAGQAVLPRHTWGSRPARRSAALSAAV